MVIEKVSKSRWWKISKYLFNDTMEEVKDDLRTAWGPLEERGAKWCVRKEGGRL